MAGHLRARPAHDAAVDRGAGRPGDGGQADPPRPVHGAARGRQRLRGRRGVPAGRGDVLVRGRGISPELDRLLEQYKQSSRPCGVGPDQVAAGPAGRAEHPPGQGAGPSARRGRRPRRGSGRGGQDEGLGGPGHPGGSRGAEPGAGDVEALGRESVITRRRWRIWAGRRGSRWPRSRSSIRCGRWPSWRSR